MSAPDPGSLSCCGSWRVPKRNFYIAYPKASILLILRFGGSPVICDHERPDIISQIVGFDTWNIDDMLSRSIPLVLIFTISITFCLESFACVFFSPKWEWSNLWNLCFWFSLLVFHSRLATELLCLLPSLWFTCGLLSSFLMKVVATSLWMVNFLNFPFPIGKSTQT